MIPVATDTPIRRMPWVNYALIAVNAAVFLADYILGGSPRAPTALGQLLERGVLDGGDPQLYQFFTYQFLHAGFGHLAGNMMFLWVFGNPVNGKMGHGPYLLFYVAGGVFAATGHVYLNPDFAGMVGASGAIAAVTTAYLALFPRSYITIIYWFFFIGTFELPSWLMILFKMILWDNILAPRMSGAGHVAFDAHLAGYLFGFVAAVAMLTLRFLPRDQFDIMALWRRWLQRQGMRAAMADPNARARAHYGRVARPISMDSLADRPGEHSPADPVAELRMQIAQALSENGRDRAAELYEKILEIDPRQVLPRTQQLEVANQLCTLHRLPQAAAAYEKYLSHYAPSPEADEVRLLLGIIYARDLHQYEVAEAHLRQSLERFTDERRREQCLYWLKVVADGLGRGNAEHEPDGQRSD